MSGTIDRAFVEIIPLLGRFAEDLQAGVRDAINGMQHQMDEFRSSLRGSMHQGAASSQQEGTRSGRAFGMSFVSVAKNLIGGAAIYGAVSKAYSFAKDSIIGFNSTLEQSTIAFTTLLGGAKQAKTFLDGLQQFAKTTPFEFKGLISNSQTLLGMGIAAKDIIPDLTALGDSVASVGGNADTLNNTILAFAQINAKGKVSMDNMNQLLQGGMPNALKILAAQYHVTTGQMVDMISKGKVMSDKALPLLVKGLEKGTSATVGLGGMMDKQSKTFSGALSNINDALQQSIAGAFRPFFAAASKGFLTLANWLGGPQFQHISDSLSKGLVAGMGLIGSAMKAIPGIIHDIEPSAKVVFTQILVPAFKTLQAVIPAVARILQAVFVVLRPLAADLMKLAAGTFIIVWNGFLAVLRALSPVLQSVAGWMTDNATMIRTLVVVVGTAVLVWKVWTVTTMLYGRAMMFVRTVMILYRDAMIAVNAVMAANPVMLVVIAVAALAAGFFYLYKNSETFRNGVNKVWTDIKVAAVAVWDFLKGYLKAVFAFFMAIFTFFKDLFTGKWSKLWKDFIAIFARLWGVLRAYINVVLKVLEKAFSLVWTGIKNAWSAMLRWFTAVFKNLWGVLSRAVSTALRALTALFNMIWNQIKSAWSSLWHSVMSIFNSLWSALRRTVSSALHTIASIFSSTWNTIKNAWSGMLHWFGSAFSSIWSGLMGVARGALNGFKSLFTGLVNGLKAIWHGIESIFMTPVKWVVSYVINPLISAIDILPGINIKPVHLAEGGVVPGEHDRDDVPIYATPGEVVVPKNVVKKHGGPKEFMASLGFGQGPMTAGSHHSGWNWNPIHDIEKVGATVGHAVAGVAATVAKYIRKGAAAAVSLALKPLRGLSHQLDHFGEFGVDIDHSINNVMDTVVNWIRGKEKKDPPKPSGGGVSSQGAAAGSSAGAAQAYARSQLSRFGWGADQMGSLIALWNIESGWRYDASNGNSGPDSGSAFGIPQSLPGSKMASSGADWRTNPATQINWGLNYIKGRYGSPSAAYAFETSHSPFWYEKGAWSVPNNQLAMLHKKEMVVPAEQAEKFRKGSATAPVDPNLIARAVANALSGMAIQFDGDGLARLVTKRQGIQAVKGVYR